jgi:oxygen-independent coproporphyrinogen-3 oxidase
LKIFNKSKLEEYTIESNVESLDEDKLKLFKDNGINRISIGVQSFNHKLLTILGRDHSYEMVIKVINDCKKIGLANINVDLIYGINDETMDDLKEDLDKLLKLDIPHVSLYSLIIEPHTKLYLDKFKSIDEDMNADMYDYINKVLKDNNYQHYEISNYAKKGYESKHNLVYWQNLEYYGFGLSAASFIDHNRYENTRSFNRYIEGFYKLNDNILSNIEMMQNEMILGLRLLSGVNKEHFYQKYNKRIEDVFNIDNLIRQGLLIDNGINIYIPEDKLFISNSILLNFLD